MSLIIKPGDALIESSSTMRDQVETLAERREIVFQLIKRNTEMQLWDSIQAKDLDPRILEYVIEQLEMGMKPRGIRRSLGIYETNKVWKKILAGIRQGIRIDSTAMFARWHYQNENLSEKIQGLIEHELSFMQRAASGELLDAEDRPVNYKGFTKELTMAVDALNRLRQGTVKLGKELNVFEQPGEQSGGKGGVTIHVHNNVPFPTDKEIQVRQEADAKRKQDLIDKAKAIATTGRVVDAVPKPQT